MIIDEISRRRRSRGPREAPPPPRAALCAATRSRRGGSANRTRPKSESSRNGVHLALAVVWEPVRRPSGM
eukprot:30489-Pelagococcus_subviridis.AAC.3